MQAQWAAKPDGLTWLFERLSTVATPGRRHDVASQVRWVGEAEFGRQRRTIELTAARLCGRLLEANDATELLGREADGIWKLPPKLPPAERGTLDQRVPQPERP